jgi:protein tyrosine phosphatase (PTP) superfamily phosphohydrolase (DUF442 family)
VIRKSIVLIVTIAAAAASSVSADEAQLEKIRAYLRIDDRLATSGQIQYEQIQAIKDAGFDIVVNLAPAREDRNFEEGFRVTEKGMTYIQIPVDWENPSPRDLELFFDVMKASQDRQVYVHCFANMRVSVFVYLYRTLVLGVPEDEALVDLAKIWDPATEPQWARFIERMEAPK